jgi:hypothetical protein
MNTRNIVGWVAVALVTVATSFWAFWGVNEAFHEGWCKPYLWMRIVQLLAYLGPAVTLCTLALLGLRWPRVGAALFVLVGVTVVAFILYDGAHFGWMVTALFTAVPALVGLLFLIGRPEPKRVAYALSAGLPLLIIVVCGAEPVVRVSTRFDDCDRGARVVEGNGVKLLWAPAGPGWTRDGLAGWDQAVERASRLTEDGTALADEPQYIWRLPTREEIVRSLTRGNQNAGGTWDSQRERPSYDRTPDKESPLWDPYAPLIYLWTAEQQSPDRAWIVVYHGGVFSKPKAVGSPSFGFRAVRDLPSNQDL